MNQSELLAHYRKELRRSKRWRHDSSSSYDDSWRRYIDLYQGKHYDAKSGTDQLTVNLIFSTINVIGPATAINHPRFVVNARKPESQMQAILTEEVLNYLWRTHKFQREFRLSVLDWLLVGHGWLKVGYKAVKDPEPKKTGVEADQYNKDAPDPVAEDEGIDDREDVEGNVESEMIQDDDRPFLERLSVFDMYVDPDARHPKEMRWIAQRVWRPLADVKVDSRYSATQRAKVTAKSWSRWDTENGDARSGGSGSLHDDKPDRGPSGYVEVIEFYDIKRGTVATFTYDGDEGDPDNPTTGYLIKPAKMPYAMGHPFVMLRNYEVPDHFYPIGDVAQIESLQLELNETRNQMLNFRKKYRRAWLYKRDAFDREGIDALQSEQDNVLIPMADMQESLANVITPMPTVITPPEFFDQTMMISNDMDRVSGISDYQRGAQGEIRRTATEAAMIQDAANARAQDRISKIENILSEVGERVIGLMQQYLTGEHVARVVTIPVNAWINYSHDHIQGQFDFEVQGGSTEPQNETFRRQSALQIVDAAQPFIAAGVVNMPALWQEILTKGFGKKDAARFVNMPPPPPELRGSPLQGGPPGMEQQMPPEMMPPPEMAPPGVPPPMGGGGPQLSPEDFAMMMAAAAEQGMG